MSKSAIIAIGYNNPRALVRLLDSLNRADYGTDAVPLIISLDHSGNDEVEKAAKEFQWQHGEKKIRTFAERQGLRKHVMSCGEYLHEYDALYVFEDDTLAAESFYQFGEACIEFYAHNERIAGISLYSHAWNQNANFPFEPIKNQYDTYFMQYAPSWGQIWMKESWFDFIEWYHDNRQLFDTGKNSQIPEVLYSWGDNSWLKYHIAYCAIKKKYFVYPYSSYSTDFVEKGTHFVSNIARFQVNLIQGKKDSFFLAPFSEEAVCYNAFFENEQIAQLYQKKHMDVTVDLYGCQTIVPNSGFVFTTRNLPYEIIDEFALQLRPLDLNVLMKLKGSGIYLYDTSKKVKKAPAKKRNFYVKRWDYFMKDRFLMLNEILPLSIVKMENLFRSLGKGHKK